ncbi:DNA-processing protein DprA [Oenococcus oeni]|uniref:DNA protecting protein DprA n=2 Tax=Oenococcus oeni TaxID=1247 RepID=A0A483BSC0_OENOE|nr:DNA-processing protein DprA [Oenococcus oeni]KGI01735.1 DNA-binding protein [Oenococcus oeni IOEB_C52]MDV7686196.1 DNA-protecting protein DprA [Oenococcus oeni]OIK56932.1 DNA protecting protein DprA [Oenococcus oeni]OIM21269.1 DNA protecting protein DprA [Oenococcus oeni]OIM63463.1 DNA protecting protein DprA [Oenococcus oeni]
MKLRDYLFVLHAVLKTPQQEHYFYKYILNNQMSENDLPLSQRDFIDLLGKYENYQFLQGTVVNEYKTFLEDFINEYEKYRSLNFLAICDREYPKQLKEIYQAPIILFYEGSLNLLNSPMITIVGTRTMTNYGKKILEEFVPKIIDSGIAVVSGLAKGIDAYAHQLALEKQGTAIAVIGNGTDISYPAENQSIQKRIISDGLLLSEYFPKSRPKQYHFPARNRILAGLTSATLVVEAKERSGSLITAAYATQENRNVLAIPGDLNRNNSNGTNKLIADGAKAVLKIDDILNEIICY